MIHLPPFILLLLVCTVAGAHDVLLPFQKNRQSFQLRSPVMSVKEETFSPPQDSTYYLGNSKINLGNSWNLVGTESLVFDTLGRLVQWHTLAPDSKKKMRNKAQIFYYKGNKLIAISTVEQQRGDSHRFQYKRSGLLDHYDLYNQKNELQSTLTFAYNKYHKVSLERETDKERTLVALTKHKYNGEKLQHSQVFDQDQQLVTTTRYSELLSGDETINESYALFKPDGSMKEGLSLVKNKSGNVLERSVINADRQVTDYRSFRYDEFQNVVDEKLFSPVETRIITEYTYDPMNNWIRKEVYHNGWLQIVVVRTVVYGIDG